MKALNIISWILFVIIGLVYMLVGVGKFSPSASQMFIDWQLHPRLAPVIGILEIVGGVTLIVPRTTRFGLIILSVVMTGAAITHFANAEYLSLLRPSIFASLFLAAYWMRTKAQESNSSSITTKKK